MTLNLGDGVEAARSLHQSETARPLFDAVRAGILSQVQKAMNHALECEHITRHDATGYARALRDVWVALEGAATGARPMQIEKPGPVKDHHAAR